MKRRTLLQLAPCLLAPGAAAQPRLLTRAVPSTGEQLPLVGLGTWITFNVGRDAAGREQSTQVLRAFLEAGGKMVDSSPMYGSAQEVIGHALQKLGAQQRVFAADKVWTSAAGAPQVEQSRRLWAVPRFDLLQVHNLLAWEKQLALVNDMKAAKRVRYVGITTSEGRRHDEFEKIMRTHKLDFVQFTYNILDRDVEERLLPLAQDRGIAVIANRPFREGLLVRHLERHRLPGWARDIGCATWAQVALKFVVSHPAVTCAIPATSSVDHCRENMAVAAGPMPDAGMRRRMADDVARL